MANIQLDLSRFFDRLNLINQNRQRLSSLIGGFLLSQFKQNMANERDPYGNRYKKHSDNYTRRTASGRALPKPYKILRDKGLLFNSLTQTPTPSKISLKTNVIYAATHQYGRGNIPARPFFPDERGIPDNIKPELRTLIRQFVRSLR